LGITISASVTTAIVSGLGIGLAPLINPGNLATMAFLPLGSLNFIPTTNPVYAESQMLLLQGWGGVAIQDIAGLSKILVTPETIVVNAQTSISLIVGSNSIVITSAGIAITGNVTVTGTINATGDISAGSVTMQTHTHRVIGVQGGTGTITTTVGAG
jgi:phage baseplate assembly protein gpV